jgi:hypothetical protein
VSPGRDEAPVAPGAPITILTQWDHLHGSPTVEDRAREACEDDRRHLEALDRWQPSGDWPQLSQEEREWVMNRVDELAAERRARADAHRERIASRAGFFGREVAGHRVLLKDAQDRLEAMAILADTASDVLIALVPFKEAVEIIEREFGSSYRSARPESSFEAVA